MSSKQKPITWRGRDLSTADAIMRYRGPLHIDSVRGSVYLPGLADSPLLEEVLWSDAYEVDIRVICRLPRERVNAEWRRREVIEDAARAAFVPTMQSRLEGATIASQGETAWAAVLDGRFVVEVQRILRVNTLCVFSLDGVCVHRELTNVSFGAAFGADGSDVATWQERAQRIVDGLLESGNELGALPGVAEVTLRLRGPSGRLHADRLAEVFGYTRAKLGRLMRISPKKLLATPESESLQKMLKPFEQIARLLVLNDDEAAFRTWLNAPNTEFDGRSPNDIIGQQGPQIVADLVRDIITNRGG